MGHVLEEGQGDRLTLLGRQRRQRRVDDLAVLVLPGVLFWTWVEVGQVLKAVLIAAFSFVLGRPTAASAQLVQDLPVDQPQQPGLESALGRIKAGGAAPDRQENFLDDLLGGGPVQALMGNVENQRRIAAVKRAERLLLTKREIAHELVVRALGRRTMHRLSVHPVCVHRFPHWRHVTLSKGSGLRGTMAAESAGDEVSGRVHAGRR